MAWKKELKPEMNFDDLLLERQRIDDLILKHQGTEAEKIKTKLKNLAGALGVSVPELLGLSMYKGLDERIEKKERKKRAAKLYRNPDNPEETYKGFGKRPAWLQEKLDAGANPDDFMVKQD